MDLMQNHHRRHREGLTEYIPSPSTGHMIITENCWASPITITLKCLPWRFSSVPSWPLWYCTGKIHEFLQYPVLSEADDRSYPRSDPGAPVLKKKSTCCWKAPSPWRFHCSLGGIVLLFVDNLFNKPYVESEKGQLFQSFSIGIWQCSAMIPGVSRRRASIIGGMQQNLTRSAAAEFFFLAVPHHAGRHRV